MEMEKKIFEAQIWIDGFCFIEIEAKDEEEASEKLSELPALQILKDSSDNDLNIDVVDIWVKETE